MTSLYERVHFLDRISMGPFAFHWVLFGIDAKSHSTSESRVAQAPVIKLQGFVKENRLGPLRSNLRYRMAVIHDTLGGFSHFNLLLTMAELPEGET